MQRLKQKESLRKWCFGQKIFFGVLLRRKETIWPKRSLGFSSAVDGSISCKRNNLSIKELKSAVYTALERNKLLREAEVKALTNIGKTKRNALMKAGLFPRPVNVFNEHQLPGRTNYWVQGEIIDYLQVQIDARNQRLAEIASHGLNGCWLNQAAKEAAGAGNA